MQQSIRLSVVIPCYNEEEALPRFMPRLLGTLDDLKNNSQLSDFEVIVVNDRSTDNTPRLLNNYSQIEVIENKDQPRGYGRSLKMGFAHARGDWLVFMDADNTYCPEDLSKFLEKMNGDKDQLLMGQRALASHGMSWVRGLGNGFFAKISQFVYPSSLSDVCCGYRLFHSSMKGQVLEIAEDGLDFSLRFTLKMMGEGYSWKRVPIRYDKRLGDSKLSVFSDGFAFLWVVLQTKWGWTRAFKHRQV